MLSILGHLNRACNGLTRRQLLKAGGAGLFGLSLPKVLAAEANQPARRGRARSVLFVFLFGGPSQLETLDMKPDAPSAIRGPFRPIASRTPGRGGGEIDLVMRERDGTVVFVEVRSRSGAAFGGAGASIGAIKQQRIIFAARHYLLRLASPPPCRFDVVLVETSVQWLKAAFDAQ